MLSHFRSWLRPLTRPGRQHSPSKPTAHPQVESLETRQVPTNFGNGAHLVENTQIYPADTICRLEISFPKGGLLLGSGALVDKNHVLTAAHNLYRPDLGGYATRIVVTPAERLENGSTGDIITPFGSALKTRERVAPGWFANNNFPYAFDLGLITLNRSFANSLGFAALMPDSDLTNLGMNTAGYPGNSSVYGFQMYSAFGRLARGDWSNNQIWFTSIDTSKGQSGAPILIDTPHHERYIVAVISHENADANYATRITPAEEKLINMWIHEDNTPSKKHK
jgi:glutamyl endopeptidase